MEDTIKSGWFELWAEPTTFSTSSSVVHVFRSGVEMLKFR